MLTCYLIRHRGFSARRARSAMHSSGLTRSRSASAGSASRWHDSAEAALSRWRLSQHLAATDGPKQEVVVRGVAQPLAPRAWQRHSRTGSNGTTKRAAGHPSSSKHPEARARTLANGSAALEPGGQLALQARSSSLSPSSSSSKRARSPSSSRHERRSFVSVSDAALCATLLGESSTSLDLEQARMRALCQREQNMLEARDARQQALAVTDDVGSATELASTAGPIATPTDSSPPTTATSSILTEASGAQVDATAGSSASSSGAAIASSQDTSTNDEAVAGTSGANLILAPSTTSSSSSAAVSSLAPDRVIFAPSSTTVSLTPAESSALLESVLASVSAQVDSLYTQRYASSYLAAVSSGQAIASQAVESVYQSSRSAELASSSSTAAPSSSALSSSAAASSSTPTSTPGSSSAASSSIPSSTSASSTSNSNSAVNPNETGTPSSGQRYAISLASLTTLS